MNILRIDASLRKKGSYSRVLSDRLITQLQQQGPISIKNRDLADGISLINEAWITSNFTDVAERTTEQRAVLSCSDALVSELKDADTLVIALPIYNFNVPAMFKAWIDQIVRSKVTFQYTENGPQGLLNNKKAYVIIASGGTQLGSKIDFVSDYINHVLAFIGITDVTVINSSGLGRDEQSVLNEVHQQIDNIQ